MRLALALFKGMSAADTVSLELLPVEKCHVSPCAEELSGLQSMGPQRVGHD